MKVIFLDRDGVINKDPGGWTTYNYVTQWKDFLFLPGSKEAIKKLTEAGYQIIIISNQAGINRKYFTLDDLKAVTDNMIREISSAGGRVYSTHYCPHRPDEACGCRKPDTGLFEKATKGIDIDFQETYFIGDAATDIEAGKRMGCRTILVLSGKSCPEDVDKWVHKPDLVKKDLLEAVGSVLKYWR